MTASGHGSGWCETRYPVPNKGTFQELAVGAAHEGYEDMPTAAWQSGQSWAGSFFSFVYLVFGLGILRFCSGILFVV